MLHEWVDEGYSESRNGARILRGVSLASETHALHGLADVVEMRGDVPYPVEYKRGRPKPHRADEVQLCAQALCLEEMTGVPVREGALFYGRNRRRKIVAMDTNLRDLTLVVAAEARVALELGTLPAPVYDTRRCEACSMIELCRPEAPRDPGADWMERRLTRAGIPE